MTSCVCPVAAYCDRHRTEKNSHWHRLCQTRPDYFDAWERGRGPGQKRPPEERAARRARIKAAAARQRRLISWLQFFRHPEDIGLGDTAHRLNMRSCRHPDVHAMLEQLLKQCSCSHTDAVDRLNEKHSYQRLETRD